MSGKAMSLRLAALMAGLGLIAGSVNAAVILNEDFESYTVGNALSSPYTSSNAVIAKDVGDTVDPTNVLAHSAGGDTLFSFPSGISGKIEFSLDMKFPDNTTARNIYLWNNDGTNRPLYIQVRTDNRLAVRVGYTSLANKYLANPYAADQWYRLTATINLDSTDGGNSTIEEINFYTLKTNGEIDQQVGHFTDLETYGKPTVASSVWISGTGTFDNWYVNAVPEPGSLSLLGLSGLLLMRRGRRI